MDWLNDYIMPHDHSHIQIYLLTSVRIKINYDSNAISFDGVGSKHALLPYLLTHGFKAELYNINIRSF